MREYPGDAHGYDVADGDQWNVWGGRSGLSEGAEEGGEWVRGWVHFAELSFLYLFSLKGVEIFGSSGGRVPVALLWMERGKGLIRIYTGVYGCLFLT